MKSKYLIKYKTKINIVQKRFSRIRQKNSLRFYKEVSNH